MKQFLLFAAGCLLCVSARAAELRITIDGNPEDAGWTAETCVLAAGACQTYTHTDSTKITILVSEPTKGLVSGIASGQRLMYEKSRTGGLGTSIRYVEVGTLVSPKGLTCSLTETIVVKGVSALGKLTDPRVVPVKNAAGKVVDAYVTGCQR